jgi:hypothetical protein
MDPRIVIRCLSGGEPMTAVSREPEANPSGLVAMAAEQLDAPDGPHRWAL